MHQHESDFSKIGEVSKLWSRRWSVAHGWRWHYERDVTKDTAYGWLVAFETNEPDVVFVIPS